MLPIRSRSEFTYCTGQSRPSTAEPVTPRIRRVARGEGSSRTQARVRRGVRRRRPVRARARRSTACCAPRRSWPAARSASADDEPPPDATGWYGRGRPGPGDQDRAARRLQRRRLRRATGSRRPPARCWPAAWPSGPTGGSTCASSPSSARRPPTWPRQIDARAAHRARRRGDPDRRQRRHPHGAARRSRCASSPRAYAACARPASRSWSAPAPTSARSSRSLPRSSRSPGPGRAGWPPPRPSRSSRRAAARCRSARSSARSSRRRRRCCSAPTSSTRRPTATARWPRCCCRRCSPPSAWSPRRRSRRDACRGEGVLPIAAAAVQAVRTPGTELDGTEVAGARRGVRGLLGASCGTAVASPDRGRGARGRRRTPTDDGRTPGVRRDAAATPRRGALAGPSAWLPVGWGQSPPHDRQDAQQVGVDPDQADGQRERRPPATRAPGGRRRCPARRSRSRGSA